MFPAELPESTVVNPVHLSSDSPRTCIFWQVRETASPLGVRLDQTSLPPPHSHNQCTLPETNHDEENRSLRHGSHQNAIISTINVSNPKRTLRHGI